MSADAYSDRRQIEEKIAYCDRLIKRQPTNLCLIQERQYLARIAIYIHARIERREKHDAI